MLLPPLHGKEQECLRLVELPGSYPQAGLAGLCCITGGEDCLLRQQLLPLRDAGTGAGATRPPGAFGCSALLAEHAQGTAVKCLALLPLPSVVGDGAAQWLLLSAGARQVLMAHRLRQAVTPGEERTEAGAQQGQQAQRLLPLLCDELAVKEPPILQRRPKAGVRLASGLLSIAQRSTAQLLCCACCVRHGAALADDDACTVRRHTGWQGAGALHAC